MLENKNNLYPDDACSDRLTVITDERVPLFQMSRSLQDIQNEINNRDFPNKTSGLGANSLDGGLGSGKHEISKSGAVVGPSDGDSRQGHGHSRVFGDRAVMSAW